MCTGERRFQIVMVTQAVNCFRKKLCRLEKVDDKTDFHGVISIRNGLLVSEMKQKLVLKYIFLISFVVYKFFRDLNFEPQNLHNILGHNYH